MNLNLFLDNDNLIDHKGKILKPDPNGIVNITVDGMPKRFVLSKLIPFLKKEGNIKIAPKKEQKYTGEHRRKPVIVTTPENKKLKFESSAAAARELNICRTNIPHALSGRYSHVNGYKFKYAKQ